MDINRHVLFRGTNCFFRTPNKDAGSFYQPGVLNYQHGMQTVSFIWAGGPVIYFFIQHVTITGGLYF